MADEEKKEEKEKQSLAAKLKQFAIPLLIILNLAGSLGGLALVYLSTIGSPEPKAVTEETDTLSLIRADHPDEPIIYTLDLIKANLDGFPTRILQTEVNVEMLDEKGFEEVVSMGPQARDAITRLLNGKKVAELETIQGKLFLKDQLISTINGFLEKGVVKDVYFTQFIIQ